MNGLLIIDKPEGLTSAEVVRRVKARARVKVGHLGTLDPFATGVLPLCLGEATKVAQFLNCADKTYAGLIRLGSATDTGDRTGTVVETAPAPSLTASELRAIERRFTGDYAQVPPMYSALKREGTPLYKLARRGLEVERPARIVHLAAIRLEAADATSLSFEVSCSKGTYVRVLAEDIGKACGSVAHLESLRRTRFGPFELRDAAPLESWQPDHAAGFVSIRQALSHLAVVEVSSSEAEAVRRGQTRALRSIAAPAGAAIALLVERQGEPVAVVERSGAGWRFARVLLPAHALQA